MTFPQEGVLFSPQPTVAFVEVFIKPEVFLDETHLRSLRESIAAVPTKENPPYTPGCNESILSFAGRLSENLNPNDFALVFAISTEKVSDVIPGSPPEGMTNFQERRSDDGKHHFPKSGGDIFFHIKSGPHAEAQDSIDKMIDHIKKKLAGFVQKEIYVRKALNGLCISFCFPHPTRRCNIASKYQEINLDSLMVEAIQRQLQIQSSPLAHIMKLMIRSLM